jgi:vacuolar-type H+-ATPase subunit I/STV1
MNIKELFDKAENGTLNYTQFQEAVKANKAKIVDLSDGGYVSKQKYDDDLSAKDSQIATLNEGVSTRDINLAELQKKLEEAGTDAEKLSTLSTELSTLKDKYNSEVENYKNQLSKQAYEFAVREFAGTQKFSSNAAKRDFVNSLIAENLKLNDKNEIMGASDFVKMYTENNADAFLQEKQTETAPTTPTFVQPTGSENTTPNGSPFNFNFTGVRPHKNE